MNQVTAFTLLTGLYLVGLWVSKRTKSVVSSGLFCGLVMMVLFWTGLFPKDIVSVSRMDGIYTLLSCIIIVNMGTTLNFKQFKQYWRLILTVLVGCALLTVSTLVIGNLFVDKKLALGAFPILLGGNRATQIMTDALDAKGLPLLAAILVLINGVQSFFGLPMIAIGTRSASKRMLAAYRRGEKIEEAVTLEVQDSAPREMLIDRFPASTPENPFFYLLLLGVVGTITTHLGGITSKMTNGVIGVPLFMLSFGAILYQVGLLPSNPLQKTGLMPFFMFATVVGIYGRVSALSTADFIDNIVPILFLLVLGTVALLVGGLFMSKLMKIDSGIAIAACFGAFTGYPLNFAVAREAILSSTEDEEERDYLDAKIQPCVALGSIISVTITSVIVAGVVSGII